MSKPNPTDRKYTKEHEWVEIKGTEAVVGITAHAAKELGDRLTTGVDMQLGINAADVHAHGVNTQGELVADFLQA